MKIKVKKYVTVPEKKTVEVKEFHSAPHWVAGGRDCHACGWGFDPDNGSPAQNVLLVWTKGTTAGGDIFYFHQRCFDDAVVGKRRKK